MRIDERFDDTLNFRDMGGLECNDGRHIRNGLFYRGAGLFYFSEEELKEFEKLGIRTIMDLRSGIEIEIEPDPKIEGADYIEHSGLVVKGSKQIDWSPKGMKKIGGEADEQIAKISHYYTLIAFDNEAFRLMVNEIVNDRVPIYLHCATGKDRTGFAAAVVGMLLNVKEEEMKKDYLLSNVFRKRVIDKNLEAVKDIAIEHPEINFLIELQDGVREEIFDVFIDSVRKRYASFDEYIMKEYDISAEKLAEIRDRYLEK